MLAIEGTEAVLALCDLEKEQYGKTNMGETSLVRPGNNIRAKGNPKRKR